MYPVCLTNWSFLQIVIDWKPLTVFAKGFILDLWLGPDYTSRISKNKYNLKVKVTLSTKAHGQVKTYTKLKSKYCEKGTVPCKSIRKLVWLNTWNSWTEMLWKIAVIILKTEVVETNLIQVYSLQHGTLQKTDSIIDIPKIHFSANFLRLLRTAILPLGKMCSAFC